MRERINVYLSIRIGRYKYIISFDLYHLPEGQKVQLKRQGMKRLSQEHRATLKPRPDSGCPAPVFSLGEDDSISMVKETLAKN